MHSSLRFVGQPRRLSLHDPSSTWREWNWMSQAFPCYFSRFETSKA